MVRVPVDQAGVASTVAGENAPAHPLQHLPGSRSGGLAARGAELGGGFLPRARDRQPSHLVSRPWRPELSRGRRARGTAGRFEPRLEGNDTGAVAIVPAAPANGGAVVWASAPARRRDAGDGVLWSTFLGQTASDKGLAVALTEAGEPVAVGRTRSVDFPTTVGSYSTENAGLNDVFVAKLTPDGSNLIWSTLLGSSGDDAGMSVALAADGDILITGLASVADWPTTAGAFDETGNGRARCGGGPALGRGRRADLEHLPGRLGQRCRQPTADRRRRLPGHRGRDQFLRLADHRRRARSTARRRLGCLRGAPGAGRCEPRGEHAAGRRRTTWGATSPCSPTAA